MGLARFEMDKNSEGQFDGVRVDFAKFVDPAQLVDLSLATGLAVVAVVAEQVFAVAEAVVGLVDSAEIFAERARRRLKYEENCAPQIAWG